MAQRPLPRGAAGFLDAFGVPAAGRPTDTDAALYRSVVAGRRLLILLDNARDPDQVRQLLPGSPGCLVLVTSRRQVTSLVAREQAMRVTLDLLAHDEACDLMAHILGAERVHANGDAVAELVTRCARLPLALSIAAARALTSPRALVVGGLSGLSTADSQETGTRAVFSWSRPCSSSATPNSTPVIRTPRVAPMRTRSRSSTSSTVRMRNRFANAWPASTDHSSPDSSLPAARSAR